MNKYEAYIKHLLEDIDSINGYKIPEICKENSILTDSVRDIGKWKTKVLIGNSGGNDVVGKMVDVGYLAISADNIMIPISRYDEHRAGVELLEDYYIKNKIIDNTNKFITIYPFGGNSYVYMGYEPTKQNEIRFNKYIKILDVWNKNTNWNIPLLIDGWRTWGYNDDGSHPKKSNKGSIDFVNEFSGLSIYDAIEYAKNLIIPEKDTRKLTKEGKKVIDLIEQIWINKQKNRDKQIFKNVYLLLELIKPYINRLHYEDFLEDTLKAQNKNNIDFIINLVFSFMGIKNHLHSLIRQKNENIIKLFGNIDYAYDEFNRLSNLN